MRRLPEPDATAVQLDMANIDNSTPGFAFV